MSQALIIVDVQNDFCPGGALAVQDGDAIVPAINAMQSDASAVILTQDWHPADHRSFAANHDAAPFSMTEMSYGPQVLWPVHCVQGTAGAGFHPDLDLRRAEMVIRKGYRAEIDSYSAFFENDRTTVTGLSGYLRDRGVSRLTFVGLATDFCVAYSALDAARLGFSVEVRLDACRAIDLDGSLERSLEQMRGVGITLVGDIE